MFPIKCNLVRCNTELQTLWSFSSLGMNIFLLFPDKDISKILIYNNFSIKLNINIYMKPSGQICVPVYVCIFAQINLNRM